MKQPSLSLYRRMSASRRGTDTDSRRTGRGSRLGLLFGAALCAAILVCGDCALAAAPGQSSGAMRSDEQWGTGQMPSPGGGQLSIGRDEKTGDIEMNVTAPRQNADPNAWQQAPIYLAPQVYPNAGSSSGYQPGYQPPYRPGNRPGYRPGYPNRYPDGRPNYPGSYPDGRPDYPNRYPSGQTGWPGAPSQPWPPSSGQYPGQNAGQYPSQNPGGLYPPPTDGWHWYPGYQGDPGPYPPGVMPLNDGLSGTGGSTYGGIQGGMPFSRRR